MALEFCVLASGSKGNCTLIRTEKSRILLDLGIGPRKLSERLERAGETAERIDAVVVTHAHTDHVGGAEAFLKKHPVPVYAPYSVAKCMERSHPYPDLRPFDGGDFFVRDLTVSPFALPHDVPCYGYSFYCAGSKVSFLTDLGSISENVLTEISDSDAVVLESNHDVALLRANPKYPDRLKARIAGGHGHLSNDDCATAVPELVRRGVKQIVLAHLSEQNNDPMIALRAVREALEKTGYRAGRDVLLDVAQQDCATKLFEIL